MANQDDDTPGIDRRQWLKKVGAAAGGAALLGTLAACDTDAPAVNDATDGGLPTDAQATDAAGDAETTPNDGGDAGPRADLPGPIAGLTPLRRDGSHPLDYVENIVIVQMENRSFDHMLGSLSLLEGRAIEGLKAGLTNIGQSGKTFSPELLGPEAFAFEPDPPHGHNSCMAQWANGTNQGFVTEFQQRLKGAGLDRSKWVMGYHDRAQLPVTHLFADEYATCEHWYSSILAPTWPNRFYSHCATSQGSWANSKLVDAPTPYSLAMDAGLTFGVYPFSKFFYFSLLLGDLTIAQHNVKELPGFFEDCAQGTLPNISVVEPGYGLNDDHPEADIRNGQAFLGSVYEALRKSPQWDRTLMVVFYDEHGGFYDHVAPPKVEGDTRAAAGFDQLGFRVPGFVMGGLAARGMTLSSVVDHASVPALISRTFGLDHVNERSRLAGDLSETLDLSLIEDAARPLPPAAPKVDAPFESMRASLQRPSSQPELMQHVLGRGMHQAADFKTQMETLERMCRSMEDVGRVNFI